MQWNYNTVWEKGKKRPKSSSVIGVTGDVTTPKDKTSSIAKSLCLSTLL